MSSSQAQSATIQNITGQVEIHTSAGARKAAESGTQLTHGDRIVTGADSIVELYIPSGKTTLTIPPDTLLVIPPEGPITDDLFQPAQEEAVAGLPAEPDKNYDEVSEEDNADGAAARSFSLIQREDAGGLGRNPVQEPAFDKTGIQERATFSQSVPGGRDFSSSPSPIDLSEVYAPASPQPSDGLLTPGQEAFFRESEPVSAAADTAAALFGQVLVQQNGVLGNDSGTGLTVISVDGQAVAGDGATVVAGNYGTLSIQANGRYTYDASDMDLHSDLVAFWSFNEAVGSTTVADHSSVDLSADTARLHNNAEVATGGMTGNALQLDGTGDYVSVGDSVELNIPGDGVIEARTISLFFQPASTNNLNDRQVLFAEGGSSSGFVIYIQNNTLYAGAYNGSGWTDGFFSTSLSGLDTSEWHNITLSLDGTAGTMEAWFDGTRFGDSSTAQVVSAHNDNVRLGGASGSNLFHDGVHSGAFSFEGGIDDVRVFNRALNAAEIRVLSLGADNLSEDFTYTVEGAGGETSTSTLSVSLSAPLNHAPLARDDALNVAADQTVAVNSIFQQGLLANDGDPDGDSLVVTLVGDTDIAESGTTTVAGEHGTLIIAANGTYSYVPFANTAGGTDSFLYTVSDGTSTTTASLAVNIIPDGPANADTASITESALPDNYIYTISNTRMFNQMELSAVDVTTGASVVIGQVAGVSWGSFGLPIAVAGDGALYSANGTSLYTVNPQTAHMTAVGAHGAGEFVGMTFAPDGTLYAAGSNGHFYRVNTETGTATDLGGISGYPDNISGLAWHDGALYSIVSTQFGNSYLARISPSESSISATVFSEDLSWQYNLRSLTSVNGELKAVHGEFISISGSDVGSAVVTLDASNGQVTGEVIPVEGVRVDDASSVMPVTVSGNVLANDVSLQAVERVETASGEARAVTGSGVEFQGQFGTLTIYRDGSYTYQLDNNLQATDQLEAGETASERFVYSASDSQGIIHESVLTVFVNGASDIHIEAGAEFSGYNQVADVTPGTVNNPLDFIIQSQTSSHKITEIRIGNAAGMTFDVPAVLTDSGTITGNRAIDGVFIWRANAGQGLDSFDARAAGLLASHISSGREITVSARQVEYDVQGNLIDQPDVNTQININLVDFSESTGTSGADTISSSSANRIIDAGAGNDIINGGSGIDFHTWTPDSIGTQSSPATDTITSFTTGSGGDVLDLSSILPDHAHDHLDEYLNFSFANGDTTIAVSSSPGGEAVQNIVLDGIDLSALQGTTDVTTLTNWLTDNGNLIG